MKKQACSYEIKNRRLILDCSKCNGEGSLSSKKCLLNTLEILSNERIQELHHQKKHYRRIYHMEQLETLYGFLDVLAAIQMEEPWNRICKCNTHREWSKFLKKLMEEEALRNPLKAYDILQLLRKQYSGEHVLKRFQKGCVDKYIKVMDYLLKKLESTVLIKGYIGGRQLHEIVKAVTQPSFVSSSIEHKPPEGTAIVDRYLVMDSEVRILENGTDRYYFIKPPELSLSMKEVESLHKLKNEVSEKYVFELIDPLEARSYFRRLGMNLLNKYDGDINREKMTDIFARYTAGYGILEIFFNDERIRDIYVDSPTGFTPLYVDHEVYGICTTNVKLSDEDLERISSKFRSIGGRPFDEANPVMDMELQDIGVRVTGVREPSTFDGIAFAFRKRRDRPWTLPMLVKEGMFTAKTAAILSLLVGGKCSILVTGARGSGKTSLLTALMAEIKQYDRIVLMEDTPEIPVDYFKRHGWKIEHLRNQAPIARNPQSSYELSPEQNLRAALRLGESVLILGEVRGPEARALFEAMRVGAAGNAVLGTIHGSTPYDTWDRVTNDLGVPSTSFKAVDVVLSLGYREDREGIQRGRYLAGITEVSKVWENNPQTEDAFFDVMHYVDFEEEYNLAESELIHGIASRRNMSFDECLAYLDYRGNMVKDLVDLSIRYGFEELLEIEHVIQANNTYVSLIKSMALKEKIIDYGVLHSLWRRWLQDYVDGLLDR